MTMMSVKLLSVLVSLAMMLTGTYGVEAPQAARTLTLSNVTLTVNGESATLEPTLSLGVAVDGAKALFNAAVHSGGSELFPVQLTVTEEALTALVKNADTAFTVPASAIEAVTGQLTSAVSSEAGTEMSQLIAFYTQEYIPAYTRVIQKAMDPAYSAELRQKSQALMEEKVDRGAGQVGSMEIDGQAYDCTTYHYTLDAAQLMALSDEICTLDEDFAALYSAIFKLYDMLPEESGLKGLTSFADVAEKTGLTMTAEYTDSIADDGSARQQDVVVTLDLAAMVASRSDSGSADLSDASAVAPIEIVSTSTQVGDECNSTASMEYTIEGVALTLNADSYQGADGLLLNMEMKMDMGSEGSMLYDISASCTDTAKHFDAAMDFTSDSAEVSFSADADAAAHADDAGQSYTVKMAVDVTDPESVSFALTVDGDCQGDGSGAANVNLAGEADGVDVSLSFDAAVTTDAIEEAVAGSEALVIDDLTKLDNLTSDETAQGKLLQAAGSLMADAGTLASEASVNSMVELMEKLYTTSASSEVSAVDKGIDASSSDEEEQTYDGAEAEVPEDDGELPFGMPQFAYMPEGWAAIETDVDTAYDQVTMSFADESYENSMVAIFAAETEQTQTYVMNDAGKLVPAEALDTKVESLGEGSWVASMVRGGVSADLYFTSETIDLDTIAQIINGLTF